MSYLKYITRLEWLDRRKNDIDKHHIIPIGCYGPDIAENITLVTAADHKKIHETLDIARRYYSGLLRKQRLRENWHIILTESDIEWRANIQRVYLEWVDKLPSPFDEMHEIKIWELCESEANKLHRLTWDTYDYELWDVLHNHSIYVDIQKEISKDIYFRLKNDIQTRKKV